MQFKTELSNLHHTWFWLRQLNPDYENTLMPQADTAYSTRLGRSTHRYFLEQQRFITNGWPEENVAQVKSFEWRNETDAPVRPGERDERACLRGGIGGISFNLFGFYNWEHSTIPPLTPAVVS